MKNSIVNNTTSVFFHSRTGLEQFRFPLCYPLSQIVLKLLIDCQATARTMTNTNRKENSLQFRKMFEKIAFKVQNFVFTSKCTCVFLTVGQTKISSSCQLTFLEGAQPRCFNSRLVSFLNFEKKFKPAFLILFFTEPRAPVKTNGFKLFENVQQVEKHVIRRTKI